MTIKEKIQHSLPNEIYLYKEGVFWMAYEQSAYWFHLQKGYKPTKKLVKAAGQYVVSVGFPESALKGIDNFKINEDKQKIIALNEEIDLAGFEAWKEGIVCRGDPCGRPIVDCGCPEMKLSDNRATARVAPTETMLEKIRTFDLSNATPMQCMNFLSELKRVTSEQVNE